MGKSIRYRNSHLPPRGMGQLLSSRPWGMPGEGSPWVKGDGDRRAWAAAEHGPL